MEQKQKKIFGNNLSTWMESKDFIIAMRRGLLLCIPFFIIGSFCVLLTSFPVAVYQEWIREVCNGMVYQAILWVYHASMGSVTLFVILTVSHSYASQVEEEDTGFYMLTSLVSYMIFVQSGIEGISYTVFEATWMFTGILITIISCVVFRTVKSAYKHHIKNKYQAGVDVDFQNTVEAILPITCVIFMWAVLRLLLALLGVETDIQNIGSGLLTKLFGVIGTGAVGAALFLFLSQISWFFGIHGSDMLHVVSTELFEKGLTDSIAAGVSAPIFSKTFFDVFALIGGSGSTLCLLAAICLRNNKRIERFFKAGIVPALFNINEIVLFGLPVVLNPIMIIPFVLVPLVQTAVAAISIFIGLVPPASVQVGWTTPILFSGYLSTGSIAGSILQAVLFIIGTTIYFPFLEMSDAHSAQMLQNNVEKLKEEMIACEKKGEIINLKKGSKVKRETVKTLTRDLKEAITAGEIKTFYQPQITSKNTVYGVEALLRWIHPEAGFMYPPMVIELARQNHLLDDFGIMLIERAAQDLEHLSKRGKPLHMAVNILPVQFESDTFCDRVEAILAKYHFGGCTMCFEITEQMALATSGVVPERMLRLKKNGIVFHMDDFGMGHSSMQYLQDNEFEAVKLDGSLVKHVLDNERCQTIIAGIYQMADSLNYELIAEYVETEEQRQKLEDLGCCIYQGYLYSPAVPMDKLEVFLEKYTDVR